MFRGSRSRSEVVATFLAILELCKTNKVTLEDDVNGENPNVVLIEKNGVTILSKEAASSGGDSTFVDALVQMKIIRRL